MEKEQQKAWLVKDFDHKLKTMGRDALGARHGETSGHEWQGLGGSCAVPPGIEADEQFAGQKRKSTEKY